MKRIIETIKGRFVVKDIPSLDLVYDDKLNDYLFSLKRIKLSEITEEQARGIVDYPIILEEIQGGDKMYTYYNYKLGRYDYGTSLVDSLESLLKSHNIEITNNTYIFKV